MKYAAICSGLALVIIASLLISSPIPAAADSPNVVTQVATDIETTSAELNGDLISLGGATNVTVYFSWGTEAGVYSNNTSTYILTEAGEFSKDLTGLAPDTTYYFIAVAVGDDTGQGVEREFTTDTEPPLVTTDSADNITSTSATLNGRLTNLGTAENVTVYFSWGTEEGVYSDNTTAATMNTTGEFSDNLTGLTPDTTYYFIAVAEGDGDDTTEGFEREFSTGSSPPTVTTSAALDITSTSATLNGSLTGMGTADNVTVYFEWGTDTNYGSNTTAEEMNGLGSFTAPTDNLSSETTYHFRAIAIGDGSAEGEDQTFTTGITPPSVTTNSASSITTTAAKLNGNLTNLGTSENVTVYFEWGATIEYGNTTTPQTINSTGAFSATLTGLSPGTTYYFIAKAVGDGTSYGQPFYFQSVSAVPPPQPPPDNGGDGTVFAGLSWPLIAAIVGGAALLIFLLFILIRPGTGATNRTQQEKYQQTYVPQQTFPCPKCGVQNTVGMRFCTSCGERFQYNCPQCGAIVDPNFKACTNCGVGLYWEGH